MRTVLENGTVITPVRRLSNYSVVIEDGLIHSVQPADEVEKNSYDEIVDVKGYYITPGFIDIHVHGGGGFDIMTGTPEAIEGLAKLHMSHGTTSMLPTTTTGSLKEIYAVLDAFNVVEHEMKNGPCLPGMHLEGPYVSAAQSGAQDPKNLRNPDPDEYMDILSHSGRIVRWSIAPELDGALEMGRRLSERGVLCAVAHSDALYDQILESYESGFELITHLYSGCSSIRRINAFRYSGVVEAAYVLDEMCVEIIADGVHLPESLLRLAYKAKGPEKTCLITDAIMAAGLGPGEYQRKDGRSIIVEDNVAKLMDRSSFAGSVATADRLVQIMVEVAGASLREAVTMMTLTPARLLGLHRRKGIIAPGKDADLVVLDRDFTVSKVLVAGGTCHEAHESGQSI